MDVRARVWGAALLAATGCTFGTDGVGGSAQIGESADDGATESPVMTGGDEQDGAETNAVTSTTGEESTGVTAAGSVTNGGTSGDLTFAQGPVVQIGDVAAGGHQFLLTLRNVGDGPATNLAAMPVSVPLAWVGGEFPGLAGTCGDALDPGTTCEVQLQVSAGLPGRFVRAVTVEHDAGQAVIEISGGAVGDGTNLVENGGAEEGNGQLPGWSATTGDWQGTTSAAAVGSRSIYAGYWQSGVATLAQDVDVSAYEEAIAAGGLAFVLSAQRRAYSSNNDDPGALAVHFMDAGGGTVSSGMSSWASPGGWVDYQEMWTPPPGTQTVRVELMCNYVFGSYCNAYFDEVRLFARYPAGG